MNIFVGSLPFSLEEAKLKELFEEFGEVTSAKIISDKYSGRSKGFGFVEMSDDEQAKKAIEGLNGTEVEGRSIVVNEAEERKPDSRRSNFGGGDRGGFNRGGGHGRGGDSRGGYRGGDNRGGDNRGGGNRRSGY
jgi:RNA recognition motif-containing protein